MQWASNPFGEQQLRNNFYNKIKKNRVFRSQKKLTEGQASRSREHRSSLKTQLKALIDKTQPDQSLLKGCISELKQKLKQIKSSQKMRKLPLQQSILRRKHTHSSDTKNNGDNQAHKKISKSLNLLNHDKIVFQSGLLDLKQARNEIKIKKNTIRNQRICTEKQSYRYQDKKDEITELVRKMTENEIKKRSVTQQIIRSERNPARMYHLSPRRKIEQQKVEKISKVTDKTEIKQITIHSSSKRLIKNIDLQKENLVTIQHNEKIGDLSTIAQKKETLNFLGESCIGIQKQLSPQKVCANTSKILDFIGWRTKQLKNAFSEKKPKKRKTVLDKLSKIFPKGFFA